MKTRHKVVWTLVLSLVLALGAAGGASAADDLEAELVIITPVAKFVVDASLKEFAQFAKEKYGLTVKTSAINAGTPVAFGRINEWNGRPQADLFWGGESALFDKLSAKGLLEKLNLPKALWEEIPATIGKPKPLPLRDPAGYWVGTTLEPYGICWNPQILKRLGLSEIKTWDDLTNPKLKGWIAQCTPDRSSSNHASYEVIFQMKGLEKGWEWAEKVAANTGIFTTRSVDVPSVVAKGEFGVGFAVPSYMAFENVLAGYELRYVAPKNAYATCEPIAILKGAKNPKAAKAFIEFILSERGQKIFMERGLFSLFPKYKVQGPPGSNAEKAVIFTGGFRSFYEEEVENVYNDDLAQSRYSQINEEFQKRIVVRWNELKK
ncbi:MAG: extracellular solute-binding protein [Bacillota bacterium]|nr:extracellular solute-binding protein [Bacillota bacterium]